MAAEMLDHPAPPAGFLPVVQRSPVADLIGPVYTRGSRDDLEICLLAQPKHCNLRGTVHGGILAALADIALGYTLTFASDPPYSLVTASLTIDYAGSATVGDWMLTKTDVQRRGSRLAFANCYIFVGERRIVRASGVFIPVPFPGAASSA